MLPVIQMAGQPSFSMIVGVGSTKVYRIDKQPTIVNYLWEVYTDAKLTSLASPADVVLTSFGAGHENEIQVTWKKVGTYYLIVFVTDDLGCSNRVVFVFHAVENIVFAVPDTATITKPVQLIRVLDNDFDPDEGDVDPSTLAIVKLNGPYHGSVNVNGDGTITFVPEIRYEGRDSFVYIVCDNVHPNTACDTAIVRLNILYDSPLAAVDDHFWTYKDQPKTFDVSYNDIDPDGQFDLSSVKVLTDPKFGAVVVGLDGKIKYSPYPGFVGQDNFYYEICNTGKPPQCDQARVIVDVIENMQIIANRDDVSTMPENDVIISVLKNDRDPEGLIDTTSLTVIDNPKHGTISVFGDGTIGYAPEDGFAGLDSFIYRLCDKGEPVTCDTAIVYIDVVANRQIIAIRDDISTGAGEEIIIPVLKNDVDPEGMIDTTTLVIVDNPEHGVLTVTDGVVKYIPTDGFTGHDSFIYRICDSGIPQTCDTAIVSITVEDRNLAIVANHDKVSISVDSLLEISVLNNDYDPDGMIDTLSLIISKQPENGNVTIESDGTITYIPDNGFAGVDSFIYSICDFGPVISCDTALVTIIVTRNHAPLLTSDTNHTTGTLAVNEKNGSGNLLSNDTDPDGDKLTISEMNGDVTGSVSGIYGVLKWNSDGTYIYTPNTALDTLLTGTVVTEIFDETVSDGNGGISHTTLTITITGKNNLPVLSNDTNSTVETEPVNHADGSGNLLANDYDPDGSVLLITKINGSTSGTVSCIYGTLVWDPDGTYTYTPNEELDSLLQDESVVDVFVETVSDGQGGTALSTLTITIQGVFVNPPAGAQNDYVTIWLDEITNIPVLENDSAQMNGATLIIIENPVNGSANVNSDHTVTYSPNPGYAGVDSFKYEVCDNYDVCDTATVFINIENLKFPELFSPNGDGVNDYYVIGGIEKYPNNRILIYNRWGNKVYDKVGYLNDWDGYANVKFVIGSKELPVGVYYYILRYNNTREKAGALFLER